MTKERLSQLYYITKELRMWEDELEGLSTRTRHPIDTPRQKVTSDTTGSVATRRTNLEHMIAHKRADLEKEKSELTAYIVGIEDSYIRQIMYMRHVKMYTWHKIGSELNVSPDAARMTHDRFLKENTKKPC